MRTKLLGLAAAAGLAAMVASSPSYALSFYFSFSDFGGNIAGTVTGEIEGLTDNSFSTPSAVIVQSYPLALSTPGGYLPPAPFDAVALGSSVTGGFTVTSGQITGGNFYAYNELLSPYAWELGFLGAGGVNPGVTWLSTPNGETGTVDAYNPPTFVAATPIPAALPLFASGLGAMGLFGWRKKRKAAATIAAA